MSLAPESSSPALPRLPKIGQTEDSVSPPPFMSHSTFNQQSPNNVQVGTQADLSDLTIKSEKDDFAAEA